MNPSSPTALSGMTAARLRMDVAAHNIANLQTPGFRRQQVLQQADADGGVTAQLRQAEQAGNSLETDVVDQFATGYTFVANLRVIQGSQTMLGTLLDMKA
ncbi:MAG: flagellar basal body protein [Burkholderiaceae bacterium]|nr:flagellar basal body protein [Burkholderiaceae bacterium]